MTSSLLLWPASLIQRIVLTSILTAQLSLAAQASSQRSLNPKDCSQLLTSHLSEDHRFARWDKLPAALKDPKRFAVIIRVPLNELSLPAHELVQPRWLEDLDLNYIGDFSTLTNKSWYFIVEGPRDNLLKLHQVLPQAIGPLDFRFEILKILSPPDVFRFPAPTRMFELGSETTASEGEVDPLSAELAISPDTGLAIYEQGRISIALPRNQAEYIPSSVLSGFAVQRIPVTEGDSISHLLLKQAEDRYVLETPTHWIFSQSVFQFLKSLEGVKLVPEAPTSLHIATWLIAPRPKTNHAPLQPVSTPAVISSEPVETIPPRTATPKRERAPQSSNILSEAEVKFLNKKHYVQDMLAAWSRTVGVNMQQSKYLDISLEILGRKFLTAEERARIQKVREGQEKKVSDGQLLYRFLHGKEGSARAATVFAELWKALSIEIQPSSFDPTLNPESIAATIKQLDHMVRALEPNGKPKAKEEIEPFLEVEEIPEIPAVPDVKAQAPSRRKTHQEALSTEAMREWGVFVTSHNQTSWYEPGEVLRHFRKLIRRLVEPIEIDRANKKLEAIQFLLRDSGNARIPGKSQRKVIEALRILAGYLNGDLAKAPASDEWLQKVMAEYNKRIAVPVTGEIIPGTEVSASVLGGNKEFQIRPKLVVDLEFKESLSGFKHILTSSSFVDFVRAYSHFAIDSQANPGEKELVYFEAGPDRPFLFNFKIRQDYANGPQHVEITKMEKIDAETESKLYAAMAKAHKVHPWIYHFSGGRRVQVGQISVASLSVSGKVYTKLQVKHQLSEGEIKRVLGALKKFEKANNGSYISNVDLEGIIYTVFVKPVDGEVALQTLFQKSIGKPQPVGRH